MNHVWKILLLAAGVAVGYAVLRQVDARRAPSAPSAPVSPAAAPPTDAGAPDIQLNDPQGPFDPVNDDSIWG